MVRKIVWKIIFQNAIVFHKSNELLGIYFNINMYFLNSLHSSNYKILSPTKFNLPLSIRHNNKPPNNYPYFLFQRK